MNTLNNYQLIRFLKLSMLFSLLSLSIIEVSAHQLPNHVDKTITTMRRLVRGDEYNKKSHVQEIMYGDQTLSESFGSVFDYHQFIDIQDSLFALDIRASVGREKWHDIVVDNVVISGGDLPSASVKISPGYVFQRDKGTYVNLHANVFAPIKYEQFALGGGVEGSLGLCKCYPNSVDWFFSLEIDKPIKIGHKDRFPYNVFNSGLQIDAATGVGLNIHEFSFDIGYHFYGQWKASLKKLFAQNLQTLPAAVKRNFDYRNELFGGVGYIFKIEKNHNLLASIGISLPVKDKLHFIDSEISFWGKLGFAF